MLLNIEIQQITNKVFFQPTIKKQYFESKKKI